jgi:8-amino-7-oxononanoate synthase
VLDFTSALYLGLRHRSPPLCGWSQLTTGVPAALSEPSAALRLAARLASLVGCEQAVLLPSTLHLFWDVFGQLARAPIWIGWDSGCYPVAGWGIERAMALGIPARPFRHVDPESLAVLLRTAPPGRRPVVVTDGFCPGCGRHAPLAEYTGLLGRCAGTLIVDDTQALGVFGSGAGPSDRFGRGGGGSLARAELEGQPQILVGASMAKAFGAPLAFLAGARRRIGPFIEQSATRVHCSPPSAAAIAAATAALDINQCSGDDLRRLLASRIGEFRIGLEALGLAAAGDLAPVQRLANLDADGSDAAELHTELERRGVLAVLQRGRCSPATTVSFLVTARHQRNEIEAAIEAIQDAAGARLESARRGRWLRTGEPARGRGAS